MIIQGLLHSVTRVLSEQQSLYIGKTQTIQP